jgi:hypothetical protein
MEPAKWPFRSSGLLSASALDAREIRHSSLVRRIDVLGLAMAIDVGLHVRVRKHDRGNVETRDSFFKHVKPARSPDVWRRA